MSAHSFFRLSGLAVVLGSIAGFLCQLFGSFFYGNTTAYANQPLYALNEFVLATATILLLLGLPGVYGSRAKGFGIAGLVGTVLLFTAEVMIGVFANLWGAMVDPWLATQAPSLANGFGPPAFFAFYNIEEIALVVGSVLVAIPLLRGRVSPRWPAFALLLSVVLGVITFFFGADANTLVVSLADAVPHILLLAALVGLGYQAWARPTPDSAIRPAQPSVETGRPVTTATNLGGAR
jgi:hypothetical protein